LRTAYEVYLSSVDWGRMRASDRAAIDRLFGANVPQDQLINSVIARTDDRTVQLVELMLRRGWWDDKFLRIAIHARHWGVRLKVRSC